MSKEMSARWSNKIRQKKSEYSFPPLCFLLNVRYYIDKLNDICWGNINTSLVFWPNKGTLPFGAFDDTRHANTGATSTQPAAPALEMISSPRFS